jgi:hypothetical protein
VCREKDATSNLWRRGEVHPTLLGDFALMGLRGELGQVSCEVLEVRGFCWPLSSDGPPGILFGSRLGRGGSTFRISYMDT